MGLHEKVLDAVAMDAQRRIPREWFDEFEAAAKRPLEQRMRYAFIKTYKPALDDVSFHSFNFDGRVSRVA